jgi:hypothetical protein
MQMKICRGSPGECFVCGMTTIDYKPRCLISQKFAHMTSLGTLQWIPSYWIWKRAMSTSSLQWQTWTSIINIKHYEFQNSSPFLLSILFLSTSVFVHWSWSFLSILLKPPKFVEFDHVKPSLVHDFFHIQSIGMIPLVQFNDIISFDVYKRCENKSNNT